MKTVSRKKKIHSVMNGELKHLGRQHDDDGQNNDDDDVGDDYDGVGDGSGGDDDGGDNGDNGDSGYYNVALMK